MPDYTNTVGDFLQNGGSANDAIRLKALRDSRLGELSDQAAQGMAADWGGGPEQAATHADVLSRFFKIKGLQADINEDPLTGLAAAKHTQDTENIIGDSYVQDNPQVKKMRDEAVANKVKEAAAPNAATAAGNLAVEQVKARSASELQQGDQAFIQKMQQQPGAGGASSNQVTTHVSPAGASFTIAPPHQLNANEQALADSAGSISALGQPLLKEFEQRYKGIDTNPQQYGSSTDMLTSRFGKGWYSLGGMTENDPLLQKTAAIQAWGMRALMSGRINRQMMDLISAHLPQPGFSPGANYDRLRRLITEVIPAQLEGIRQGRSFNLAGGAQPSPSEQSPSGPYSGPGWQ